MTVTTLILGLIVIASVAGLTFAPALISRGLFRPYWLVPRREYATLITSGFLHANFAHLLFNAFTLWSFGRALESVIGQERFLILYLLGLVISNGGTWLKHRHEPEYRSLGASGAILAVLFASIVVFPRSSIFILPIPVPIPAPLFAVAYLGYTWFASRQARGRINHDAHLSGALTGLVFVAATDPAAISRALRMLFG